MVSPQQVAVHDPDTGELLGWVHQELDGTWVGGRAPRHRVEP